MDQKKMVIEVEDEDGKRVMPVDEALKLLEGQPGKSMWLRYLKDESE
jgi:hypothetical protein